MTVGQIFLTRLALVCAALKAMRAVVVRALDHRKKNKLGMKEELTVDHIVAAHRNDKEAQVGDCLTYILSGIPRISSCECIWVYRIIFSRLSTIVSPWKLPAFHSLCTMDLHASSEMYILLSSDIIDAFPITSESTTLLLLLLLLLLFLLLSWWWWFCMVLLCYR